MDFEKNLTAYFLKPQHFLYTKFLQLRITINQSKPTLNPTQTTKTTKQRERNYGSFLTLIFLKPSLPLFSLSLFSSSFSSLFLSLVSRTQDKGEEQPKIFGYSPTVSPSSYLPKMRKYVIHETKCDLILFSCTRPCLTFLIFCLTLIFFAF